MKIKKQLMVALVTILLVLTIALASFIFNQQSINSGKLESVDVAYSPFESLGLFWVAKEKEYFIQNNLNITLHKYDTGAGALGGVIKGEADIVVGTTEFPFAVQVLNNKSIQTIASMSKSNFVYLVGRTDRGIDSVSDLRGKTIGTTFGTIAHYYLGRFLLLNGLSMEEVNLVDLVTPPEWVNAVVNGSIDAVATAQPSVNMAQEGLGDNGFVWSIQSNQPLYAQVITNKTWIAEHPELCVRFLKALYQAEQFVLDYPNDAKLIVKQHMNFSDAYIEKVWLQNQYTLSLDQSLIATMEAEARWLITSNLTNQTEMADFLDYVSLEALYSVNPRAVSIIR